MTTDPHAHEPTRPARATLADLRDGELARVARTCSAALRSLFVDLGLGEGDEVRVRRTGRWCVVDTARGCIPLEIAAARSVAVEPVGRVPHDAPRTTS